MKKIIHHLSQYTPGFALPTILIASVVMMTVLLAAVQASVSIRTALDTQYYTKISQEAAESGIARMIECFKNAETPQTGVTYKPDSTSCTNATTTNTLSMYVLGSNSTTIRTRYEVTVSSEVSGYRTFTAKGITELFRSGKLSGDATRAIDRSVTAKVQTQALFTNISSSGSLFTCGIVNKQSYCWGRNIEGQLGNGSRDESMYPFEQQGNNGQDPTNYTGYPQLTKVQRSATGPLLVDGQELDIAAGAEFACAVTTTAADAPADRKVACWGSRENGRFGNNTNTTVPVPSPTYTTQAWPSTQYPLNIVTGADFACMITTRVSPDTTGNAWCWGNNYRASLGQHTDARELTSDPNYNPAGEVYTTPIRVRSLNGASANGINATKISATPNAFHVCALGNGSFKNVYCWGFNPFGQVGDGTDGEVSGDTSGNYRYKSVSQVIINGSGADLVANDIAVGGLYNDGSGQSCAVGGVTLSENKLYCWGSNSHGQLGQEGAPTIANATTAYKLPWVISDTYTNYTASLIAVANNTSCAAVTIPTYTPSNQVVCWGSDTYGELGDGAAAAVPVGRPTVVPFFSGKTITSLIGGAYRFCAVTGGKNYCWGQDHVGQVGDGRQGNGSRCPNVTGTGSPTYESSPKLACFLEPLPYTSY